MNSDGNPRGNSGPADQITPRPAGQAAAPPSDKDRPTTGRLGLLVAALRWRAAASAALLVVATVAVAAAAVGPLYLRAGDQSVLQSTLAAAPVWARGLTLVAQSNGQPPVARIERVQPPSPGPGSPPWYGRPVVTVDVGASIVARRAPQPYTLDLLARDRACAHLTFTTGHCPTGRGQTILSTRSARALGVGVGSHVHPVVGQAGETTRVALTVVGLYRIPDTTAPYWWSHQDYFAYGGLSTSKVPPLDAFFVTRRTLQPLLTTGNPSVIREVPLRATSVTPANAPALVAALSALTQRAVAGPDVTVGTQLPALVGQARHQQHLMTTIVEIVGLELVLLVLLLLYSLLSVTSEAREHEVALAKLRGYGPFRVLLVGLAEPAALLLLALPLGFALAWVVVRIWATALLAPGTTVPLTVSALGAALLAVAGGMLAALLAGRRSLVRPVADQLRSATTPGPAPRAVLALDAAALVLALAGVVELAQTGVLQGGRVDPIALVTPALLALAAGVIGARAVPRLCRLALPATRTSWAVGTFLALRQVVRRPSGLRHVVLLAVALGLLTFAVMNWSVARHNRSVQATFDVGADRILTVDTPTNTNLVAAVDRADPGGHQAMAAVKVQTSSSTLLAVDARRLAAVMAWPPGVSAQSASAIASYLRPRTAPPVVLTGTRLGLTLVLDRPVPPPLLLQVVVAGPAGQVPPLTLGPIRRGVHRYTATLPGICLRGCQLVSLSPAWQPPSGSEYQLASFSLTLRQVATSGGGDPWRPVAAGLEDPGRWRTTTPGFGVRASLGRAPGGGMALGFNLVSSQGDPTVAPATVPQALPAVIGPEVAAVNSANLSAVSSSGLDGNGLTLDGRVQVSSLPSVGQQGSLVDLVLAQRAAVGPEIGQAVDQVWLSPSAGPGVVRRLRAQGLRVVSVQRASTRLALLDRSGLALADDLFLVGAAGAAALALGTVVFALNVSAGRRARELAALQAMGVKREALWRSLLGEQLTVVGSAAALGVGAGLGALVLALPSVPELATTAGGPPLELGLPLAVLGGLLVAVALLLGGTTLLATFGVVSRLSPARLRQDEA